MISDVHDMVVRIAQNDEKAFRELYDSYKSKLFYFALKFTKSAHFAEEIVQEVFIKIWERRHTLQPDKSFNAYIFTTTYHSLINHLKKASSDERIKTEILLFFSEKELSSIENEVPDYEKLLQEAIDQLPPKRRTVFIMAKLEGKSYTEISSTLQITKNTVRLQIVEAYKTIKEFFKYVVP